MSIGGILGSEETKIAIRKWGKLEAEEFELEEKFGLELYAEALGAIGGIGEEAAGTKVVVDTERGIGDAVV